MDIQQSLQQLSRILPIKQSLDALDAANAQAYFNILHGYFNDGQAPSVEELLQHDAGSRERLATLAEHDMLTLDDSGEIKGCYPFTSENREHKVHLNGFVVNAMCALDALAPTSMFNCQTTVESRCAVSGKPVDIELDKGGVTGGVGATDVHVGINWMAASSYGSCSDNLCTEMIFLHDQETAQAWKQLDAANRDIYNLDEAIEFAAAFFKPMMAQS